jgi:single-strand DNA-binding protein
VLLGNLTRDPQLRYLPSNTAVCDFGLAINRTYRDRDGNQKEETCFVEIATFGRQAETVNQYMSKGSQLLVEGRLRFESWTDQNGSKRNKLSVVADTCQFIGGRGSGGGGGGGGGRDTRDQAPQRDYDTGGYDQDSGGNVDDIPF